MALSLFQDPWFLPPRQLEKASDLNRLGACDVQETEKAHIFHMDAPGFDNDALNIEVKENNVLVISGERESKHDDEDPENKWHRVERSYGKFSRAFRHPADSDVDNITASFQKGELMVTVPKAARANGSRRIAIQ